MLATAPQARALELFGLCLLGQCEDDPADSGLIDPKPYDAALTVAGADDDVERAVRNASALWSGRSEPAAGSAGLLARAKGDYQRILAALYNEAYYGGEISIIADGRQVSDLPVGYEFADGTVFSITVTPSGPYRFGQLVIDNQAPPATERGDRVDLPREVGFSEGELARADIVRQASALAVNAWRQQGYPQAKIADREVIANHPSRTLRVRLRVDPGQRAVYGPVVVEGTDRMNANFVAHQTGIMPGAEYDPDDIELARKRLRRLGVFNTASVKPGEAGNGVLPIEVTVQEHKLRRIGIGATFSTVDGFGTGAYWLHRNLFGRAERLRIEAGVAGVDGLDTGNFDYRFGATLGLPGRFTPDTDIEFELLAERENLEAYTRTGAGKTVSVTHFYSRSLTFEGSLFAQYAEFEDDLGTRRFGVAGISAGATLDTRDEPLNATSGVLVSATVTPFYEWERGNTAVKIDGEARTYYAFGAEDRTVLAGRVKAGALFGPAAEMLPPDQLYFAGGGSSVRGYAHRSIGADGSTSIGGRSLLEGSVEVRHAFTERIGVVGFVDAALVSAGSTPDFSQTPQIGAGIGARYQTGLGPLRIDAAFPLNRRPGDPTFAVYAGIGQAF